MGSKIVKMARGIGARMAAMLVTDGRWRWSRVAQGRRKTYYEPIFDNEMVQESAAHLKFAILRKFEGKSRLMQVVGLVALLRVLRMEHDLRSCPEKPEAHRKIQLCSIQQ